MEALFWSLTHRPYVTLFMVFFLALSIIEQGRARTFWWVISSYLIALLAEWGSIHYGIPFGDYTYHYEALQNDLVILGVPFFDTISFSFLSYVSFSFGQFLLAPLERQGLDTNGWLDRWWGQKESTPFKATSLKGSGLFAPLFWFGIVGFQLGITYWIALTPPEGLDADKTLLQAVTGSYLLAPILVWTLVHLQRPADPQ